jgi:ribosomal protein L17
MFKEVTMPKQIVTTKEAMSFIDHVQTLIAVAKLAKRECEKQAVNESAAERHWKEIASKLAKALANFGEE